MRMIMVVAAAAMLASCSTSQPAATMAGAGQQEASTMDEPDFLRPPALRAPRQKSATGWPNIGYRPQGYPVGY